jgi:hypothetical protein
MSATAPPSAFRGAILHFLADPGSGDAVGSFQYFEDGVLVIEDGLVQSVGAARELLPALPKATPIVDYSRLLASISSRGVAGFDSLTPPPAVAASVPERKPLTPAAIPKFSSRRSPARHRNRARGCCWRPPAARMSFRSKARS